MHVEVQKGVPFAHALLNAISDEVSLCEGVRRDMVIPLINEILIDLDKNFQTGSISSVEEALDLLGCQCRTLIDARDPNISSCPINLGRYSDEAQRLIHYLAGVDDEIRYWFLGEKPAERLTAGLVDVDTKSILKCSTHRDGIIEQLFRAQTNCIIPEEVRSNPDQPATGHLSPVTVEEITRALSAPKSQIIICKNDARVFGWIIYHGKGSCSPDSREFVDRANQRLAKEVSQSRIVDRFGVRYNPDSVATIFSECIAPEIRMPFAKGGAWTSRMTANEAMIDHALTECALMPKRPEWVLAWVRSYPNPNSAIQVHTNVLFEDMGIEIPFDRANPYGLRRKLLCAHIDSLFDAQGRSFTSQSAPDNLSSYGKDSIPRKTRMDRSAARVSFVDFDPYK